MNAIEAQMLQRSIQGVGDAFENRAARKEQARQFDLNRDDRLGQFAIEREMQQMKLNQTAKADAATATNKGREITNRVWDDTVKMHGEWVKDGVMQPEIAMKSLQAALSKMPQEAQTFLADNPNFTSIQSGEFSFQTPKKAPPALTDTTVGGRKAKLTPGGALHFDDTLSPADREEIRNLNSILKDIDKQAVEMAGKPNVEKSRALRAARDDAQSKKQSILARYSGGALEAQPAPAETSEYQPVEAIKESVPEAPKNTSMRQVGAVYQTPKGALKWTGTGWVQP